MRKIPNTEPVLVDAPAGSLEGLLEAQGEPIGCAVICHPHPAHGGTMQNKVVHTLSRAFVAQGFAALRFNFRGVGKSSGEYDEGDGEFQDVLAAIDWLQHRYPRLPLWLAGFSFGGAMSVRAAVDVSVTAAGLVSIAPAVSRFANELSSQPACPWLIVQGDQDELVDIDETIEYVNGLNPGPELAVFPDGDHFFHGRLIELRDTVETFISNNR
jgi:alpha/beta superfamily hydrolase